MNNIITHDWNTYNSNLDEDFFYSSNKETNLLEEYNQMKNDYNLLKSNSNKWFMKPFVQRVDRTLKDLEKNLWSLININDFLMVDINALSIIYHYVMLFFFS